MVEAENLQTGGPIPLRDEPAEKNININIGVNGDVNLNLGGEFKLQEIVGILTVTLFDLLTSNITVPYITKANASLVQNDNSVVPSRQQSDANALVDGLKSLVEQFQGR